MLEADGQHALRAKRRSEPMAVSLTDLIPPGSRSIRLNTSTPSNSRVVAMHAANPVW
jgi:hypothetical protein